MVLSDLGEAGCIRRISHDFIFRPERIRLGAGDDGAVYVPVPGCDEVISTDTMVEGIHFTKETLSPADVGCKLCAANFSDMAAMGAKPNGIVFAASLPADLPLSWIDGCYEGIRSMCRRYRVNILGGDMTGSRQGIVLTATVIGSVTEGTAVPRSGARPGDVVAVTGPAGDSAAGLEAIRRNLDGFPHICEVHRRPQPQIDLGDFLRVRGASSMDDISDGLSTELSEIASAGGVTVEVSREKIPLSDEASRLGAVIGYDPVSWALTGGEDYQLLFTMAPDIFEAVSRLRPVVRIGTVTAESLGEVYMISQGKRERLYPGGYDHFRK